MLGWEFPPHIAGGLGTACLSLTRALAEEGVDVTFVVPHRHGDEPDLHLDLVGANDVLGDRPGGAGRVRRRRVPSALSPYARPGDPPTAGGGDRPYGPGLFAQVRRFEAAVERLAEEESFDVVHAHDWMTFGAGARAARKRRRPLVVHVHSLEQDRAARGPDPRICEAEQGGFDAAQAVVCVSRFTAERLQRFYRVDPERLHVVWNALPALPPATEPAPARQVPEPVVLFLGRVTSQKGPDVLLEAARLVVLRRPRVKFLVAGDGDLYRPVVERAAALGLARHVAFTGFLRAADVERAYAAADLFVLPSVAEPFGLTALEAAARGVPVILTRQSGAAEVLSGALTVDGWDVEGLADAILTLLADPARRQALADRVRREARALLWHTAAEAVRALYGSLVR